MNKQKLKDLKETIMFGVIIASIIIVIFGVITSILGITYDTSKSLNLCKDNGFERATFEDIEPGYLKCYSHIYVDHIKTESSEIIKYSSWFRGNGSNE